MRFLYFQIHPRCIGTVPHLYVQFHPWCTGTVPLFSKILGREYWYLLVPFCTVIGRQRNQPMNCLFYFLKFRELIGSVLEIPISEFIPGFVAKSHDRIILHGMIWPCTTSEWPHLVTFIFMTKTVSCTGMDGWNSRGSKLLFTCCDKYAGSSRGSQFPSPLRAYVNSSTPVRVGFDNR
jgi:hypothetical protein